MKNSLSNATLEQLFTAARSHSHWQDRPVSDDELLRLYDLLKWAPTAFNAMPARFLFIRSAQARERLKPLLAPGNVEKVMTAPCTVVVAHDPAFFEQLPRLYPARDARAIFAGNAEIARETAVRNGVLQGGYLILAARALGLDCGPMSGFDRAGVDREFLSASGWKSEFLCALGHGSMDKLHPRGIRLDFDEACQLL